jgi:uncharacterized protein (DUF934 family)
MRAMIRKRQIVADAVPLLADDATLPSSGRVLVSLTRFEAGVESPGAEVGVLLPNTADILTLWPKLSGLRLIALDFPGFADGRAYSQAALLRGRCGYTGELLATGKAVVRDQLAGMERCGFDSFALREDQDPNSCLKAFAELTASYQPAQDAITTVLRQRRRQTA